jgi:pimeloyl-ACP methyl ester carboxylesterase
VSQRRAALWSATRPWLPLVPVLLASLVLFAYRIGEPSGGFHAFNETFYADLGRTYARSGWLEQWTNPADANNPPLYLDLVVAVSLKVPPHVWRAAFAAMASEKPDAMKIACRTLLIGCAKDEFFSDADRRALAAAFSNAEEILYPDLGHAPHWEQPARVARDIVDFIG